MKKNGDCVRCHHACADCKGTAANDCTRCYKGYSFSDGYCDRYEIRWEKHESDLRLKVYADGVMIPPEYTNALGSEDIWKNNECGTNKYYKDNSTIVYIEYPYSRHCSVNVKTI